MPLVDVSALTRQVQTVLADPHAAVAATGTPTLDAALALLRHQRRAGRPLATPHTLGYWYAPPKRVDVLG